MVAVFPQKHFTDLAEWHRMGEAGIFPPESRMELINGEILHMAPIGFNHAGHVNRLNSFLTLLTHGQAIVSVQNPVQLGNLSEPEPDFVLLRPESSFYSTRHPKAEDVLLLTEVSDSTLRFDRTQKMFEKQIIEIAPLAYMRGRTLNHSFIILDEAQNTTPEQMKMFLTRIGFGSKAVVTGDVTQIDLQRHQKSGLVDACQVLRHVRGIAFNQFTSVDVVRHPIVGRIVDAYEEANLHQDQQDAEIVNLKHATAMHKHKRR